MENNYEMIGEWWNNKNIELIKINEKIFALNGWNGEAYFNCWEVADNLIDTIGNKEYTVKPLYQEIGEDEFEIVGYEVV